MARIWLSVILAGLLVLPQAAHAQSDVSGVMQDASRLIETAREEAARGNYNAALSFYVRAISRQPNDARILTEAGETALKIGDVDAAFGFLGRAATMNPRDPVARAGYGRALLQSARPKDALTLFDQAVRLGMLETAVAGDRGLARDLLGENRRAQKDYRLALTVTPGDAVVTERLALSLAISGDRSAALALVQPQTRRAGAGNANRTVAFIYALTGDVASARKLAMANMSTEQADAYTPFFARLALLSAEEKAAAVNLGRMPQVRLTRNETVVPKSAKMPDGDPVAMRAADVGDDPPPREKPSEREIRQSAAEKKAAERRAAKADEEEKIASAQVESALPEAECSDLTGKKRVQCEVNARALERRCKNARGRPTAECRAREERLAEVKKVGPSTKPTKADRREAAATKKEAPDAVDACDDLTGSKRVQCKADARALERRCGGPSPQKTAECRAYAARGEDDAALAKGKKPKTETRADKRKAAERYWVQVASGRNKGDLPKEWSRLKVRSSALLGKRKPYTAPVGTTNRLVVGPFDSSADAREFVNKLQAAGISSFPWTSDAGEDVERLDAK